MLRNTTIANLLEEVADLLEFQGANPFRIRAYRNGARTIRDLAEEVSQILDDPSRDLTTVPGIGKDLSDKCRELVSTGQLAMLEELHEQVPESVLQLLRIPGLGPKKAATLHRELGIDSLAQLRQACQQEQVRALKGFGPKTEQTILGGIAFAESTTGRIYWSKADAIAQPLLLHLRECPAVEQAELAGSYRRGAETIGDLDLLAMSTDAETVMDHLAAHPDTTEVLLRGETKMSIRVQQGIQIDLRVVPAESFGAALQYFTGSQAHNVNLRSWAKKAGMKMNEYGLYRNDDPDHAIAGRTEQELYQALQLDWIPPELREARSELAWAAEHHLPSLVELSDIQGDLHMHTTSTDGKATLAEMIAAARQRGLAYIAITDHSQRVSMARGLTPERLLAQWAEIDEINRTLQGEITLLKGIECDILEPGGMDLPDEVLAQGDWIIASVHYGQNQPESQITDRILGAIENPHVHCIAHPTGRLINKRPPYQVDMQAVIQAAAAHNTCLELNANPARLDLNDIHCAAAKAAGVPVVISTDAHSTEGLSVMRYGILQARRGGLTKNDIANTRPWPEMQSMLTNAK